MYREDDESDRSVLVLASKGRVHGIDRATGQPRWQVVITKEVERYSGQFAVELLVTRERVYAATWMSNEVVCLSYPGGEEIGRARVPLSTEGRPMLLVDGQQLFVARNGQVAALTLDGQHQWTQTLDEDRADRAPTAVGLPGNVRQADDRYER